ncbi:uncharacterized protein [Procambarus clarkii]|uniref:uncharacterized protein n=1 Tax=Procambarus clarkii TaxID=6728 RepID=UPI003744066A
MSDLSCSQKLIHTESSKRKRYINALSCSKYGDRIETPKRIVGIETQVPKRLRLSPENEVKMKMTGGSDTSQSPNKLRLSSDTEFEMSCNSSTPQMTTEVHGDVGCNVQKWPFENMMEISGSNREDRETAKANEANTKVEYGTVKVGIKAKDVPEDCTHNETSPNKRENVEDKESCKAGVSPSKVECRLLKKGRYNEKSMKASQQNECRMEGKSADNDSVNNEGKNVGQKNNERSEINDDNPPEMCKDNILESLTYGICSKNSKEYEGENSQDGLHSVISKLTPEGESCEGIGENNVDYTQSHNKKNVMQSNSLNAHERESENCNNSLYFVNETIKTNVEFCGNAELTQNTNSFKSATSNVTKNVNLNHGHDDTILHSCGSVDNTAENDTCGEQPYRTSCLKEKGPPRALQNCQKNSPQQLQSTNIDENQDLPGSNARELSNLNIGTNCCQTSSRKAKLSVTFNVPEYDQSDTNNVVANAGKSSSEERYLANALPVPELSAKKDQFRNMKTKGPLKFMVEQNTNSQHEKTQKRLTPDEETENGEGGSIRSEKKSTKSFENNEPAKNKAPKQTKKPKHFSSWKAINSNKNFRSKKWKRTHPTPGSSSTKGKKGGDKLKGIAIEDDRYVPRGWKRVIEPRLTRTSKGLTVKTDVKACSPDGKTLICPKKLKKYFEGKLMKLDEKLNMHKIYRMSPSTKKKVMEKNSHLVEVVEAERDTSHNPGSSRAKAYMPLRLTFKKSADLPIGGKPQTNNMNECSKDGRKNSTINISKMFKNTNNSSCQEESSKFMKGKHKMNEVRRDSVQDKAMKIGGGVSHPESSPAVNAGLCSVVKHKMVTDLSSVDLGYDPYIFTEESSDSVDVRNSKLLTTSRKSINSTGVSISRNERKSSFGLKNQSKELNSTEPVINETCPLEKNVSLDNAPSVPMLIKCVVNNSSDNTNETKSQPLVLDENPQNSVLDLLQIKCGDKLGQVCLSQNQNYTNFELNGLSMAKGALLLKGTKAISEEECNVNTVKTQCIPESMKIKEGKTPSVCCEKYVMKTPDNNDFWDMSEDTSCIASCTAAQVSKRVDKQKHVCDASDEFNRENFDHTPTDNATAVVSEGLPRCNISEDISKASSELPRCENDEHSSSVITIPGDTGDKIHIDDLVTSQGQSQRSCNSSPRSPQLNSQETQTTERINITEVRVLSKEDGEKFALIPLAPDANREDILLELRYYKRLPHHTDHSFLINSQLFTLSPHKRALAATLEEAVLATQSCEDNSHSSVKKHNNEKFLKTQKVKWLHNTNNVTKPLCPKSLIKEFFSEARVKRAQGNEDIQIKNNCIKKINRGKQNLKGSEAKQNRMAVNRVTSRGSVMELDGKKMNDEVVTPVQTCSSDQRIVNNFSQDGTQNSDDVNCFAAFDASVSCSDTSELIENNSLSGSICSEGHQIIRSKTIQHNMMKSSKLASCLGIHLCQLRATLRVSCTENECSRPAVPSPRSRLCHHHKHNSKRTIQSLVSPTLFEMSCPLCQLTFHDLRPCSYHPDILSNARMNCFNPDSPLEALAEKLETEYWEYVGIISSVFPSKTSVALPSPYESGSTCAVHGVTQDIDLEAFCSQASQCSSLGNNRRYSSSPGSRADSHDSHDSC